VRRRHKVLGVLIVVLLLAAAFAAGTRFGDGRDGDDVVASEPTPTTATPAGEQPTAPVAGGVPGAAPGTATFNVNGRSVVIDDGAVRLDTLSLRPKGDGTTLRFGGRVRDGSGRDLGSGTVAVTGLATVKGDLTLSSVLTVTAGGVSLGVDGSADPQLQASGATTVDGASMTFARHRDDGPPEEPAPVAGPLRVEEGAPMSITAGAEWTSPAAEVTVDGSGRTTVSWAGSSEVKLADGRSITSGFGGVKGTGLRITFRREGGAVIASGELQPQQVYADGLPQLSASAGVSIKSAPRPVRSGGGGEFTWAPFNSGATDMVMMRIRPGNELARSINLALEKLPPMCGAESCPFGERGGDAAGFGNRGGFFGGGASPINAVILPGTGDERRISFDLPNGLPPGNHEMVVIVEGNFEPVTVRIPLTVSG
jgi:hypothetical protein